MIIGVWRIYTRCVESLFWLSNRNNLGLLPVFERAIFQNQNLDE
jgi:hypothetical protein